MAQRVKTVLVDDLTGEPSTDTVQFGLDGRHWELDLSKDNAKQLRAASKTYMRSARPKPGHEAARIRVWAQQHEYEVAPRGPLHREVINAYR